MSNTPRTDAYCKQILEDGLGLEYAATELQHLAEELERELAEVKEHLRLCNVDQFTTAAELDETKKELNDKRKFCYAVEQALDGLKGEYVEIIKELRKDAERYRWLLETLQSAKGGAYVTVNEHLSYYEKPEIGKEVKIQWYPITPIGFYIVEESTLDAAIDAAMKECGE